MGRERKRTAQEAGHRGTQTKPEDYYNDAMLSYYAMQEIIPEKDQAAFLAASRQQLPTTFRINIFSPMASSIAAYLRSDSWSSLRDLSLPTDPGLSQPLDVPRTVPWYPRGLAWTVTATKKQLKKIEELHELRRVVLALDGEGYINRQELVSMLPPLLLRVKPHHMVLDMCASPGSKTAQLLDALHTAEDGSFLSFPPGMVVGNDANMQRTFVLIHQSSRLGSPAFLATNHNGQWMPKLHRPYDRILCDVPCSGDGTLRKNPDIWKRWSPADALGMHRLQVSIADHALHLLAPDGLMVYSTCSMSPMEDEAVIAELLRRWDGKVELCSVGDTFSSLRFCQGISSWTVVDKEMKAYHQEEELPSFLRASMFPPAEDEAKRFHLDRCMRVLPHQQNTGGFFVALLRKKSSGPAITIPAESGRHIDYDSPFTRLSSFERGQKLIKDLQDFYGISSAFPLNNLYTRSKPDGTDLGKLYLLSDTVADTLASADPNKLHIAHAGIRVFEHSTSKMVPTMPYRLCQITLSTILPFMSKQKLAVSDKLMDALLRARQLSRDELAAHYPEEGEALKQLAIGSVVFMTPTLTVSTWVSHKSVMIMVNKLTVEHLLALRNILI